MNPTESLRQAHQLFQQEQYRQAEEVLLALLQDVPDQVQALHLLGSVAAAQLRFDEAALVLQRALRGLAPDAAEGIAVRYKLGRAFFELGRHEDAFLLFRALLESGQQRPEIFLAAAAALQALAPSGRNDRQALQLIEDALQLQPDAADAWHRKAMLEERAKQFDDARRSMTQALRLNRQSAVYWLDAGLIEHAAGVYEDALRYFDEALIVDPELADAHVSRGTSLARLRQYDEAIDSYRRALRFAPGDADAKVNLALSLLVLGQWQEALPLYEWRWEGRAADPYRHADIPAWNGATSLLGRSILLWAEQGHGDTIQFCRYVQQMVDAGAQVVLEVPDSLNMLMRSLPVAEAITIISSGDAVPAVDMQLPLMSLPLVCNTQIDAIPAAPSYLQADATRRAAWQARIDGMAPREAGRLRVGIVCSGNAGNTNDRRRSIELQRFETLAQARQDVDFFVIQPDLRRADHEWLQGRSRWHWAGEGIADFADTAAVLGCMDLLMSVDTAAAHLGGALGMPVWIALPFAPDWRWLLNRFDSPWYPSARLFRQPQAGQWDDTMLALRAALAVWNPGAVNAVPSSFKAD
ncbi:tetratricopeptide repeat protein [Herbaspirillum sp. alder98]|uniref:tetratricopeptide repeat protein n=1 Tax=Herbaspirillum sp. alder98 TaxID=2913096 RepID=UPI001CD833DF|nr:tetratricopeptide repeat protein [Herbaspirillum sp. alder98]MCA1322903.1 tetratricopeptide repeat protein [Herbaspirillum sp. alder98]